MVDKNSTAVEIAEELGCGRVKVFHVAKKIGVPVRGRSADQHEQLMGAMQGEQGEKPAKVTRAKVTRAKVTRAKVTRAKATKARRQARPSAEPTTKAKLQSQAGAEVPAGMLLAMSQVSEALAPLSSEGQVRVLRAVSLLFTGKAGCACKATSEVDTNGG